MVRWRHATEALQAGACRGSATILNTHQLFCDDHPCSAWDDSRPAYFDNDHVTGSTMRRIRRVFLAAIGGPGAAAGASYDRQAAIVKAPAGCGAGLFVVS